MDQQAPIVHVQPPPAGTASSNGEAVGSRPIGSTSTSAPRQMACTAVATTGCAEPSFCSRRKKDSSAKCRKEIRNALKQQNKGDPHVSDGPCTGTGLANATSAPGLAAPLPRLHRDGASSGILRRAYGLGFRTCPHDESHPSQKKQPAPTRRVHRSHRRRLTSLPLRHRLRPPCRP